MRRLFLALAVAIPGLLLVPLVASAANAPARIVDCSGAASWCFSPNPIQITAGSTVTWTNNTGPRHTATSDTGAWTTGNIAPGGTSAAVAFPTAGNFPYHCAIHPSMTGTVIVSAGVAAGRAPGRGCARGGGSLQIQMGAAGVVRGRGFVAGR